MGGRDRPVLVTGASGYIGGRLVDALLARGTPVRAAARKPERLARFAERGAEVVAADAMDRSSLRQALRGVRAAYYLIHSMGGPGSERSFAEYDRYAARNFALEGRDLDRIIYLGGLGRPADDLSPHLRSRLEVGEILQAGSAPATVLRAGIVIGAGSASWIMLLSLVRRLPVMVTPRWVDTRNQPIAVADVLAYLLAALDNPETAGRTYEIGGPDVLTYRQMMERTAAILGKRPLIVGVPVLTLRLSAFWVDFVTRVPASIAHPLIEGLRNEAIVHDDAARRAMPVPLTPFEEAVRLALRHGPGEE
ncbi:MAG: NmrA family NAD(P)-binding protein [Chloroflexi bacterium]|nr:NmrA family NAD(P)-binding protein [Chloroflexota bacterium]